MGRDTRILCHKFNSQGTALRILGLRVPSPRDPVPGSWVSVFHGPWFQGPRCQGPVFRVSGSRVSGLDFRLCSNKLSLYEIEHFFVAVLKQLKKSL